MDVRKPEFHDPSGLLVGFRRPDDIARAAVHKGHADVVEQLVKSQFGDVQRRRHPRPALAQDPLRFPAPGDVLECNHRSDPPPVFLDRRAFIGHREAGAVLAPEHLVGHVVLRPRPADGADRTLVFGIGRAVRPGMVPDAVTALAHEFVRRVSQHLRRRRIDEHVVPRQIQPQDAFRRRGEDQLVLVVGAHQGLFRLLARGDVGGNARQADRILSRAPRLHCAGTPPRNHPADLPVRTHDAVLDHRQFPRMEGLFDRAPNRRPIVGMHQTDEILQRQPVARRQAEHFPDPAADPETGILDVKRPRSGLGGFRRQLQPFFAVPQRVFVSHAGQGVGEDLRHQFQPLDQRIRPCARRDHVVEAQRAKRRRAAHGQRANQGVLKPERAPAFDLAPGAFRNVVQGGHEHASARQNFAASPRNGLRAIQLPRNRRFLRAPIVVGQREDIGSPRFPLPQRGQIQSEAFANAALGLLDLGLHLLGRQVDELGRQIDQQRLEFQPFEALRRIEPFFGPGFLFGLVAVHCFQPCRVSI